MKRVTARKYEGDCQGSWAVFIDGQPFVMGLLKSEVAYYKGEAEKRISEQKRADHIDGYDRDDLGESPDF